DRPIERRTEIVVIGVQAVEPRFALAAEEIRLSLLGECQEGLQVPGFDRGHLPGRIQPLRGKLTDRLQHQEARFLELGKASNQALVSQLVEPVHDIAADVLRRTANRLDLLDAGAASEDREAFEEPSRARLEQVIAPLDRPPERLLAAWQ